MLNLLADLSLYHTRLLKLNFINAISENVYLMKGVISGLGQKSTSSKLLLSGDWHQLQKAHKTQIFHPKNNWGNMKNISENTLIEGASNGSIMKTEKWSLACTLRASDLSYFEVRLLSGDCVDVYPFKGMLQISLSFQVNGRLSSTSMFFSSCSKTWWSGYEGKFSERFSHLFYFLFCSKSIPSSNPHI